MAEHVHHPGPAQRSDHRKRDSGWGDWARIRLGGREWREVCKGLKGIDRGCRGGAGDEGEDGSGEDVEDDLFVDLGFSGSVPICLKGSVDRIQAAE